MKNMTTYQTTMIFTLSASILACASGSSNNKESNLIMQEDCLVCGTWQSEHKILIGDENFQKFPSADQQFWFESGVKEFEVKSIENEYFDNGQYNDFWTFTITLDNDDEAKHAMDLGANSTYSIKWSLWSTGEWIIKEDKLTLTMTDTKTTDVSMYIDDKPLKDVLMSYPLRPQETSEERRDMVDQIEYAISKDPDLNLAKMIPKDLTEQMTIINHSNTEIELMDDDGITYLWTLVE